MPLKFAPNNSLSNVTALPASVPTDNLVLISTQTASNSANISFTTGLNGTYDEYIFKFINVHALSASNFVFQGSTNSGSSYGVTITSTHFYSSHTEADNYTALQYDTNRDLAQSTSFQSISNNNGSNADDSCSGELIIYNPSSTTYVKHFIGRTNCTDGSYQTDSFFAGYFNTTSAINAIQFKQNSGNFDGIIKLYGVKKS